MTQRTKLLVLALALLIIGAGAAAGVWLQRDGLASGTDRDASQASTDADHLATDAVADSEKLVRQTAPVYYTLDPPLIVNIKDSDAALQAGISLSTHFASTNEALKSDDPAIRSATIMALSDASQEILQSDAGKEQLLARITAIVNRQLEQDGFSVGVDGAYFTSFVVQGGIS